MGKHGKHLSSLLNQTGSNVGEKGTRLNQKRKGGKETTLNPEIPVFLKALKTAQGKKKKDRRKKTLPKKKFATARARQWQAARKS